MFRSLITSPFAWLGAFILLCLTLLALPLRLPIGPNYWDLFTYVDTAYRIKSGQLPNVDFFVPVGPVGYGLYILLSSLFSQAHTLLTVHFSILIVALPIMAVIVAQAQKTSRPEALMLVIPFTLFGLLPINVVELYPTPGFDGFGNYNRHAVLLLYVLASALLFVENRRLMSALAVTLVVLLFFTKITGFVVAAVLLIQALVSGRASLRSCVGVSLIFFLALATLELRTTFVSNYIMDIKQLVGMNTGFLLPRILTVLSLNLNVILPAFLLFFLVAWQDRKDLFSLTGRLFQRDGFSAFRQLANQDCVWLLALLTGGLFFETQNTGSHDFILLWPAIVILLRRHPLPWNANVLPVIGLIAIVVLPTPVSVVHRAIRTVMSMPKYEPVEVPMLGPIGRVSAKSEIMLQARALLAHYSDSRASFERMAKRNVLPSYILFSEPDFQVNWLISTQQAAEAILRYEVETNVKLHKIITLDFVDPIPFMLKRVPLRDVSIGNDPDRTFAKLGPVVIAEVNKADAILIPLCPPTTARNAIFLAYSKGIEGRRMVALTPCFNMLVRE